MTLIVPFDGSELSRVALVRAVQFDRVLDEGVATITVIPVGNREYAIERGWIEGDEPADSDRIAGRLRTTVEGIVEQSVDDVDIEFEVVTVDRFAPVGTIARKIREFAHENDGNIVFIGSGNAGRIVRSITVGQAVATDRAYDVMIISHATPVGVEKLRSTGISIHDVR